MSVMLAIQPPDFSGELQGRNVIYVLTTPARQVILVHSSVVLPFVLVTLKQWSDVWSDMNITSLISGWGKSLTEVDHDNCTFVYFSARVMCAEEGTKSVRHSMVTWSRALGYIGKWCCSHIMWSMGIHYYLSSLHIWCSSVSLYLADKVAGLPIIIL